MKISLRRATPHDSNMLWEWRNDYQTRMASKNIEPVSSADHVMWFSQSLTSPDRKIFIAEYSGTPVGVIRFDYYNDSAELSWTVAPEHRGNGYGTVMLRAAVLKDLTKDLYAVIKPNNAASIRMVKAAGFNFQGVKNDLTVWKIDKRRGC